EDGIYIPALMFVPKQISSQGVVLYVHEKGKAAEASPGGLIEKFVKAGQVVLAVDLHGTGETQKISQRYLSFKPHFGSDWQDVFMAYLLGRSYVGMRAEDVLICARLLHERQTGSLTLIAVGNVSVPALHAAALESDLFNSVKLMHPLASWSNVVELGRSNNQLVNTVHGALTVYDLPNLAETLGDKLTVEAPLNALGKPIKAE
ncbi:MAG: hypothetical protein JSW47_13020, partial [Phycisphaerales bacterium]